MSIAVRIHPDTIEQIKTAVDIVEVISQHVVLKKQGKNLVGLCPFHDDRSPSFSVSPEKNLYHCFSCGESGNPINFLMSLEKRSFSEVILELADRYHVPVQTLNDQISQQQLQQTLSDRKQILQVLASAAQFFVHNLHQPQGEPALRYLTETRGYSPETLQTFQIGYAPNEWDALYNHLVQRSHYPAGLVERAGLIIPHGEGNGYYDRFRHRIIIPILDNQGHVIAFGGRAMGEDQPKYLNSPETEVFNKSMTLFGLYQARKATAKADNAVVVEGYFDVIALHAVGIENAVASMGTALTADQVKLLLRHSDSKRITLNFDADQAGGNAAKRAIANISDMIASAQVNLRVLVIPSGKDPDEYLRSHSGEDYQALIDAAPLWLDWRIDQTIAAYDLNVVTDFQKCFTTLTGFIGGLIDAPSRTFYIHRCAELLSCGNVQLFESIQRDLRQQVRGTRWHGRSRKWKAETDATLLEEAETQLLRIFIHRTEIRQDILDEMEQHDLDFDTAHLRFLWRTMFDLDCRDELRLDSPELKEELKVFLADHPEEERLLVPVLGLNTVDAIDVNHRVDLVIRRAIACMERNLCERRFHHFVSVLEKTDFMAEPDAFLDCQTKMMDEKRRMIQLDELRTPTLEEIYLRVHNAADENT